jgi:DNA repair exonuclease SbcCD nuclease subunit
MQLFRGEILRVIDRPTVVKTCSTPFLMIPYMHDKDAFIKAAQEHPECPVAFAHQTFEGAKYENGFFAKDAINAELMPQSQVISGHIHSPAVFGKVWYPGSPRWLSLGDANVERHIHLVDFGTGNVIEIPTMPHLKAIWQVTDTPDGTGETIESLLEGKIKARDQLTINLQGPASWCEKRRKELTGMRPNIRFRTFLTDTKSATVRESEGLSVALQKHCAAYTPKHGTSKQLLNQMMSERIHV